MLNAHQGSLNRSGELHDKGIAGLTAIERTGYMEVIAQLRPVGNWSQPALIDAVRKAEVHTFGWPILGVTLDNRDEYRPHPTADGIVCMRFLWATTP